MGQVIIPDKAAKPVILIDGVCYEFVGPTSNPKTHDMADIDGQFDSCPECAAAEKSDLSSSSSQSAAPAAPCECPSGLTGDYRISGYSDTYFDVSGCSSCASSAGTPWNGVFPNQALCSWVDFSGGSINGKDRGICGLGLDESGDPDCKWTMLIECYDGSIGYPVIWVGEKDTGNDPTGVYNRTGGCDPRLTVTVVEV